jgi:hypothetical protein
VSAKRDPRMTWIFLPTTATGQKLLRKFEKPMSNLKQRIERLEEHTAETTKAKTMASHPDCICFPPDEAVSFDSDAEEAQAAKVLCPLHGRRSINAYAPIYRSAWMRRRDREERWPGHSEQYRKAMLASFWGARGEGAP